MSSFLKRKAQHSVTLCQEGSGDIYDCIMQMQIVNAGRQYIGRKKKGVSSMAAVKSNNLDPMKAFRAIAMIMNAREDGTKVRLASVKKVEEDVRKAG